MFFYWFVLHLNFFNDLFLGDFVMVHASYQSHLAGDVFFAPGCKPNDGIIWLLVIKAGISRINLFQVGIENFLYLPVIFMPNLSKNLPSFFSIFLLRSIRSSYLGYHLEITSNHLKSKWFLFLLFDSNLYVKEAILW